MTTTKELYFESNGVKLAGTLTLPDDADHLPVCLMIGGALPSTRDGDPDTTKTNWFPLSMPQRRLFVDEAELLASVGIASFRYDKRGCGASEGNYDRARLLDLAGDARAALTLLAQHPQIDNQRIGILGHNEGALIGLMLAAENPDLQYLIQQNARYRPLEQAMRHQAAELWTMPEMVVKTVKEYVPVIYWMYKQMDDVIVSLERGDEYFRLGDESWSFDLYLPWLKDHAENPPARFVDRVKCPVLILHSRLEQNVDFTEALQLGDALAEAGNEHVKVHVFRELDGDFRQVDYLHERDLIAAMDKPLAEAFCTTLTGWLQALV